MLAIEKLIRICTDHGFVAYPARDGGVFVAVPWVNVKDGSNGTSLERARSVKELRNVLGY